MPITVPLCELSKCKSLLVVILHIYRYKQFAIIFTILFSTQRLASQLTAQLLRYLFKQKKTNQKERYRIFNDMLPDIYSIF